MSSFSRTGGGSGVGVIQEAAKEFAIKIFGHGSREGGAGGLGMEEWEE